MNKTIETFNAIYVPLGGVYEMLFRSWKPLINLSHVYEDHKLPSVATRNFEHAGHDSYLAL